MHSSSEFESESEEEDFDFEITDDIAAVLAEPTPSDEESEVWHKSVDKIVNNFDYKAKPKPLRQIQKELSALDDSPSPSPAKVIKKPKAKSKSPIRRKKKKKRNSSKPLAFLFFRFPF